MTDEPTQVITTVLLAPDDNPHWSVTPVADGLFLLQDCALNIGLMGTRQQLALMVDRMRTAVINSVPTSREVPVNVN